MAACTLTALGSGNGDVRPRLRSPPSATPVVTVPRAQSQRGAVALGRVGDHEGPGGVEWLRVWLGRTRRVHNCPGILGLERGIRAEIALRLPAVPHSENFCQLLVWKTGARRCFSGLLENVWMVLRVGLWDDAGAALRVWLTRTAGPQGSERSFSGWMKQGAQPLLIIFATSLWVPAGGMV